MTYSTPCAARTRLSRSFTEPSASSTFGSERRNAVSLFLRTRARTVCPARDSCSAMCEPKKPEPPVRSVVMTANSSESGTRVRFLRTIFEHERPPNAARRRAGVRAAFEFGPNGSGELKRHSRQTAREGSHGAAVGAGSRGHRDAASAVADGPFDVEARTSDSRNRRVQPKGCNAGHVATDRDARIRRRDSVVGRAAPDRVSAARKNRGERVVTLRKAESQGLRGVAACAAVVERALDGDRRRRAFRKTGDAC